MHSEMVQVQKWLKFKNGLNSKSVQIQIFFIKSNSKVVQFFIESNSKVVQI
jgi:hypothetical protein